VMSLSIFYKICHLSTTTTRLLVVIVSAAKIMPLPKNKRVGRTKVFYNIREGVSMFVDPLIGAA